MARTKSYTLSTHWQIKFFDHNEQKLRYGIYTKDKKTEAQKYLIFLNGRTEFIEKYNFLPEALNLEPFVHLLTLDYQGQGGSSGLKGHINSYEDYVDSLQRLIHMEIKDKPYIILAHSMGSLICLFGLVTKKIKPQSIFLCSPFLGTPLSFLKSKFVFIFCNFMKALKLGHIHWPKNEDKKDFARDEHTDSQAMFARALDSPYSNSSPSIAWIVASFVALKKVHRKRLFKNLPETTECILATQDKVVCNENFLRWAMRVNEKKERSQINIHYVRTKHEILLAKEESYQKALNIIKNWLAKNL